EAARGRAGREHGRVAAGLDAHGAGHVARALALAVGRAVVLGRYPPGAAAGGLPLLLAGRARLLEHGHAAANVREIALGVGRVRRRERAVDGDVERDLGARGEARLGVDRGELDAEVDVVATLAVEVGIERRLLEFLVRGQ